MSGFNMGTSVSIFNSKKQYFMEDGRFKMKTHYKHEFQMFEFYYHNCLLRELRKKMADGSCITQKKKNKEMVSVIHNLQTSIDELSSFIQKMSRHADQYSDNIRKMRKHIKSFTRLSKDDDIISMLPLFD
ncbi:hypothetical protein M8C21_023928 [Ambrosia artemisiifolia]|uniref:Uncharacterized protein n=1 Tax=Ambrosia artemisiifolia TaxID=4212 RepID=A0AAD5GFI8_AMBAR|nr:hypothetical protein M8C21_023928 [Ambrosia artemisiifolia]